MISLDTETTGVDLRHSARPFFVTSCDEAGEIAYWEWRVDPLTRMPIIPTIDLDEIGTMIFGPVGDCGPEMVLHNPKFDVAALATVLPQFDWPWERTHDTLRAGHLLHSNRPKDLTSMCLHWLGKDIQPHEDKLEKAVQAARRYCRSHLPEWAIAEKGLPGMPSAKEKTWKLDTWLPKALIEEEGIDRLSERLGEDVSWWESALEQYANADSSHTLALWLRVKTEIKSRGLWNIYMACMEVLPVYHEMERDGVTVSKRQLLALRSEYLRQSFEDGERCRRIASDMGYDLSLPKSGNNKSLLSFCFGDEESGNRWLDLPKVNWSDKGNPSLDKATLDHLAEHLPDGNGKDFCRSLRSKRKKDTSLSYMEGYERFWLPLRREDGSVEPWWMVLHPNLNPTGTDTLRTSSNNPNEQNISKFPDERGFSLRSCFGPPPGKEWWSLDAENIELRIPTFESGEQELMNVFLHPKDPPYYGSYHLAVAAALYPKEFAEHGKAFKKEYEATLYQWVKNGNFAMIYGAQEETADRTYHVDGAYRMLRRRFPKIAQLSDRQVALARKRGYVETIPDSSVDGKRGYPVMCSRTEWGSISPTVPLNYHVQSTACWWMMRAMVRCWRQCREWAKEGYICRIVLQVHDELVFEMPASGNPLKKGGRSNLERVRRLQALMAEGGKGIRVPTTVSCEWHPENWAIGTAV